MYIEVNYKEMSEIAKKIDWFIYNLDNDILEVNKTIYNLHESWQGDDYNELTRQCDEIRLPNSTFGGMRNELEAYRNAVYDAVLLYREAQKKAENRAYRLCK